MIGYPLQYSWDSLVAQLVKNLPATWETPVGKSPWRRERLSLQYTGLEISVDSIIHGVTKSDRTEQLSLFTHVGGHLCKI